MKYFIEISHFRPHGGKGIMENSLIAVIIWEAHLIARDGVEDGILTRSWHI